MGDISKRKLAMTESFRIFGGNVFAHLLLEILTKYNVKETTSKGNIQAQFYIPKGECLGGC